MIAFIKISCYYPGLRVYALGFDFDSSSRFYDHILCFAFSEGNLLKEKAVSPDRTHLPAYIYTCVLCTQIRIHICQDLVHLDSSGPPSVSSRPIEETQDNTIYLLLFRIIPHVKRQVLCIDLSNPPTLLPNCE